MPTWQGWTRAERMLFCDHPQGSAQVMLASMRYAWLANVELAGSRERFAAPPAQPMRASSSATARSADSAAPSIPG